MRAVLIVNPNATSTTPATRELVAHALRSRLNLTVAPTTHRGHAAELAREARLTGIDAVIVLGGDGTVNEVVNGLLGVPAPTAHQSVTVGPIPPLAIVPGGSANVFARSLGIAADPVEATNQVIDLITERSVRWVGLGHADRRWFTFNAGVGLDAEVCARIDAVRRKGKSATPTRYVRAAVRSFFAARQRPPSLTLHVTLTGARAVAAEEAAQPRKVRYPDPGRTIARRDSRTGAVASIEPRDPATGGRSPGREPIVEVPVHGVHYMFVSNTNIWTFLDGRAARTNPGTTFDTGLGVFAMRTTEIFRSLLLVRQLLKPNGNPTGADLTRFDDVAAVRVESDRPIGLQLDGDYLGLRSSMVFSSAPRALEVFAPRNPHFL